MALHWRRRQRRAVVIVVMAAVAEKIVVVAVAMMIRASALRIWCACPAGASVIEVVVEEVLVVVVVTVVVEVIRDRTSGDSGILVFFYIFDGRGLVVCRGPRHHRRPQGPVEHTRPAALPQWQQYRCTPGSLPALLAATLAPNAAPNSTNDSPRPGPERCSGPHSCGGSRGRCRLEAFG